MENVIELNANNFDNEVMSSQVPVLVDFWADWCGPCKALAPIIGEIADEYIGKAKVAKVDVSSNQLLAGKFGVRSIPTLLIFKEGQVSGQIVGNVAKERITEKLEGII